MNKRIKRIASAYLRLPAKQKRALARRIKDEECKDLIIRETNTGTWRPRGSYLVYVNTSYRFAYFAAPVFGLWWLFAKHSVIAFRIKRDVPSPSKLRTYYDEDVVAGELGHVSSVDGYKPPFRIGVSYLLVGSQMDPGQNDLFEDEEFDSLRDAMRTLAKFIHAELAKRG